jgi:hypothetical protein
VFIPSGVPAAGCRGGMGRVRVRAAGSIRQAVGPACEGPVKPPVMRSDLVRHHRQRQHAGREPASGCGTVIVTNLDTHPAGMPSAVLSTREQP